MPNARRPLKRAVAWSSLLGLGCLAATPLLPSQAPVQAAPRAVCQSAGQTLGVSRVVTIDTSTGPHYGHQQYRDVDLLAPGEIVLTFDDGPLRPHTQPIIDALEAQCTKATFFMVGSQAVADPDMVRQIIRKGHTVGSHTWSHANMRKLTPLKARQEIELGFSAVTSAAGQPIAPFFRFPFLADTKAMLGYSQTRNMGVFSIEVDSLDYKTKSAAAVHHDVLAQLAEMGKGIILFHDIQPATAQALPGLLEALRAKGYRVVHMKASSTLQTLPEFDALARDVHARNQVASANQPLANRAATWGSASPAAMARLPQTASVQGQGAPYNGSAAGRPTGGVAPGAYPQPVKPQGVPLPWSPALASAPSPYPAGSLPPIADPAGALPRAPRVRPPVVDDWRDKVFSR